MFGDPTGPQHPICLACTVPQCDDAGRVVRDDAGFVVYRCDLCIARYVDRWCECFQCGRTWLRKENDDPSR